ncbi:MAG: DNA adenine methylase [Dehalococcoidia bacterium]|nr:DNA adenine methylase [Dehalococcoidia bacterium]
MAARNLLVELTGGVHGRPAGSGTPARPFVKWAGGKARLAPAIVERAPLEFGRYFEPFAGGAAVYFALWNARGLFW